MHLYTLSGSQDGQREKKLSYVIRQFFVELEWYITNQLVYPKPFGKFRPSIVQILWSLKIRLDVWKEILLSDFKLQNTNRWTNCLSVYFLPEGTSVSAALFCESTPQWNAKSIWFRVGWGSVGISTWNMGWMLPSPPPLCYRLGWAWVVEGAPFLLGFVWLAHNPGHSYNYPQSLLLL